MFLFEWSFFNIPYLWLQSLFKCFCLDGLFSSFCIYDDSLYSKDFYSIFNTSIKCLFNTSSLFSNVYIWIVFFHYSVFVISLYSNGFIWMVVFQYSPFVNTVFIQFFCLNGLFSISVFMIRVFIQMFFTQYSIPVLSVYSIPVVHFQTFIFEWSFFIILYLWLQSLLKCFCVNGLFSLFCIYNYSLYSNGFYSIFNTSINTVVFIQYQQSIFICFLLNGVCSIVCICSVQRLSNVLCVLPYFVQCFFLNVLCFVYHSIHST